MPARIGHYRIESVLGEGGMGTVYEARQDSPKRIVALKVIRAGYLSPELLRRFTQESQVLGRLQHPGIAQVYEAGMAKDERGQDVPFFAMEFIRGVPLTEYANQKALGTRDRLDLVAKVCDAVYHAHQKGVIHRDLKPGNILVDESGQPKILDFGVARATDSDIQQTTLQTDIGQLIGTVPYMSPEQVSGDPGDLDTRSDVYGLGVISYELLAGRLPYNLQKKMIHEAARIIKEEEPTRLSSIDRTLRGDVETIVAKALEKDKVRRYQSAESFASDIRRYLKHEPITARPASTWYQLQKFSRRNTGLVVGVGVAFALLLAGLAVSLYAFGEARRERDDKEQAWRAEAAQRGIAESAAATARAEKAAAEKERDRAQRVSEFMRSVFEGVTPAVASSRDTTMLRELMDDAAAKITRGDLADLPAAEFDLRLTIGSVYSDIAEFARAEEFVAPAGDLARGALNPEGKPDSVEIARAIEARGMILNATGREGEAALVLRESLGMWERLRGPASPEVANAVGNLAGALYKTGDLDGAEAGFRRSLEIDSAGMSPDDVRISTDVSNIAAVLTLRGHYDQAEPLLRRALDIRRKAHTRDHPELAGSLHNLGDILWHMDRFAEAEPILKEAVEMRRRLHHADHPDVANTLLEYGTVLQDLRKPADAEPFLREALEMYRRLFPGDQSDKVRAISGYALLLGDLGRANESTPLLREALETLRRLYTDNHPMLFPALHNLASNLEGQDDRAGAEVLYREAIAVAKRVFPDGHPAIVYTLRCCSRTLCADKRWAEAEPLLVEGLELARKAFPPESREVALFLGDLGQVRTALGRAEEGEKDLRAATEIARKVFPPGDKGPHMVAHNWAGALMDLGRYSEAEAILEDSAAALRKADADGSQLLARVLGRWASLRLRTSRAAEALALAEESLSMGKRFHAPTDPEIADYARTLAEIRAALGLEPVPPPEKPTGK